MGPRLAGKGHKTTRSGLGSWRLSRSPLSQASTAYNLRPFSNEWLDKGRLTSGTLSGTMNVSHVAGPTNQITLPMAGASSHHQTGRTTPSGAESLLCPLNPKGRSLHHRDTPHPPYYASRWDTVSSPITPLGSGKISLTRLTSAHVALLHAHDASHIRLSQVSAHQKPATTIKRSIITLHRTHSSLTWIQLSPSPNSCRKDALDLNQRKARSSSTETVAPQPHPQDLGDLFRTGHMLRPTYPRLWSPTCSLGSSAPFDPG
jgi:hypothetical protein